jgi:hypothetical protein
LVLASKKLISKTKANGGWGLKDIFTFAKTLATKNAWSLVEGIGLWHRIIKEKYIPSISLLEWIRSTNKSYQKWNYHLESPHKFFPIIGDWLIWKVGKGSNILIGKDPWIGCSNKHMLPEALILSLNQRGFSS